MKTFRKWCGSIALAIGLAVSGIQATTYYVDQACPTAGNGTSATCSSGPTTNNPKKVIQDAVDLLGTGAGHTINVKGIHAGHDNCPGDAIGRYTGRRNILISGKTGTSGSHIIIQASGWTAIGAETEEAVYTDFIAAPGSGGTLGWTQCSNCSSGTCAGIPGTCNEVWWTDKNASGHPSGMDRVEWAVRPDGKTTYQEVAVGDLDQQYDSYSDGTTTATLFVRWGTGDNAPGGASNPMPYVVFDSVGGWDVKNGAQYVEIRGFKVRYSTTGLAFTNGISTATDFIYFIDNELSWAADNGGGSDRPITIYGTDHVTIEGNEITCSGSEAIHAQASGTAGSPIATVLTIRGNWIHDLGDECPDLGPAIFGSPSGGIFGDSSDTGGGGVGAGDYTGSVFEKNVVQRIQRNGGSHASFIALENNSNGWIIRNNVFDSLGGTNGSDRGIEILASGDTNNSSNNNEIYNNLIKGVPQDCIRMEAISQSQTVNSNKIYNNTLVDCAISGTGAVIKSTCDGGGCASNEIRNNIISNGSQKCIDWVNTTNSNKFENNVCHTTASTAAIWLNNSYTCANVEADCSGTCSGCKCGTGSTYPDFADPSSSDFHIGVNSPAKNAGTSTGMPSGRTTDINNLLCAVNCPTDYSDADTQYSTAWDAGMDEYVPGE